MEILRETSNRGGRAENYHNSPKPHSDIVSGQRNVARECGGYVPLMLGAIL